MAIGLGKILGFNFNENFNYPYISKSITEFWRRWHISLGTWFRDYVYIPLGGNRVSPFRHYINILLVWMLTGFWHGAQWNFCLWGIYFAIILIIEKRFLIKKLEKHRIFSHIYTLFFVGISFLIFNGNNMAEIISDIRGIFAAGVPFVSKESLYYFKSYMPFLTAAVIGTTPVVKNIYLKIPDKIKNIIEPVIISAGFILSTAFLVDGSFNPFLYFRF